MRYLVNKTLAVKSDNWVNPAAYNQFLHMNVSSMNYSKQLEAQGKIVYHGIVAGSSSSFWIVEANSPEEVDAMVKGLDVFPFLQIEVKPLVSTDHVYAEIQQFMAKPLSNP